MLHKKIKLLNQTITECLNETEEKKIVEAFTKVSIKLLKADFAFVWFNSASSNEFELIYKSSGTPYHPLSPKKHGRNQHVLKSAIPDFVTHVKKRSDKYDVSHYMKSFAIIPIAHRQNTYGNIVLCFKAIKNFSKEEKIISEFIGNCLAQAITIHRFMEKDHHNTLVSARQEMRLEEERVRAEFIANAAHEIRTPLAIIRGNADIALMKNTLPHAIKTAFHTIEHEVEHLSAMFADLTILSSKEMVWDEKSAFAEVSINAVIDAVVRRSAVLAHKKKIRVAISSAHELKVMGDRVQLEKLFLNLVKNSINYGKKGGWIKIETERAKNKAVIKVNDNGIGISKEDLPNVFNRFFKADKSHTRDGSSTGLGLAIVRMIAKAHEGTVSAHSTLGKGSCFTVSIPLK